MTVAECDDSLAGVDPDAHPERERRICRVQLVDRLEDAQSAPDGPLGVVLVRGRGAPDANDRVADELPDGSAESLDLPPELCVIRAETRENVLRIRSLRCGREADEVAKENADDLALLLGLRL